MPRLPTYYRQSRERLGGHSSLTEVVMEVEVVRRGPVIYSLVYTQALSQVAN